jgi:hypothetical protein
VSKPTVFSAVGNRLMVLRAVRDTAIAGDDGAVPVARRPMADRIRGESDQRAAVGLLAQHLAGVASRYAQINEVLHAAADVMWLPMSPDNYYRLVHPSGGWSRALLGAPHVLR